MRVRTSIVLAAFVGAALAVAGVPLAASAVSSGTLQGNLVDLAGHHLAFAGMNLDLQEKVGSSWGNDVTAQTDGTGYFSATVAAGTWRVVTQAENPYIAVKSSSHAVTPSGITTTTVPIPKGATISGTLTTGGSPLAGAFVTLASSSFTAKGFTDANGDYTAADLPTGTYTVVFNPRVSGNFPAQDTYAWSYYKKGSSTTNESSATKISVKQQTKTSSATKKTGISGHVSAYSTLTLNTDFNGSPGGDEEVHFIGPHGLDNFDILTDTGGSVTVRLIPGTWRVGIDASYDAIMHRFVTYWYKSPNGPTTSESSATKLNFTGKSPVTITMRDYGAQPVG